MDPRKRLDVAVLEKYPNLSRSVIQKLIKGGYVQVDGQIVKKPSTEVGESNILDIKTDILKGEISEIDLKVIYENDNCVVVDKPEGLLTHSKGAFNPEHTVASWLKKRSGYQFDKDDDRGGIVHRLDRGTSGVIICAKNKSTLGFLQKQFQYRKAKKSYIALVSGVVLPDHAVIDLPIGRNPKKPQTFKVDAKGKTATTEYWVLNQIETPKEIALIELRPTTGRTHQLRVHMSYLKHPIVGDIFYNGNVADRMYLHAKSLEITIPGGVRKTFEADTPKTFQEFTEK